MQQKYIEVPPEQLWSFFRSKFDIYTYLKELKQLYLPTYEDTKLRKKSIFISCFLTFPLDFLRDLLAGKKQA